MRKLLCTLTILALTFAAVGAWAASKTYKYLPKTTSGHPHATIRNVSFDNYKLASLKAQNHLTPAQNMAFGRFGLKAHHANSYVNGTGNTIPFFGSWFITGSRNSVYPFSMVGHSRRQLAEGLPSTTSSFHWSPSCRLTA